MANTDHKITAPVGVEGIAAEQERRRDWIERNIASDEDS